MSNEVSSISSTQDSPTAPLPWVQIGVWGDSIVHGGCDSEMGGWVMRLRLYLWGRGLGDHVFNLGLGSNNSQDIADRIAPELAVRCGHIDHVFVSVGVNDVGCDRKLTTPAEFRANLQNIVKTIRSFGKTAHLLTMTRTLRESERWVTFNNVILQVAEEEKCGLLDLRQHPDPEDLPDKVHPTAAGHEKIFNAVKSGLINDGLIPSCQQ